MMFANPFSDNGVIIKDTGNTYTKESCRIKDNKLEINRIIYLRLQSVQEFPLGSLPEDLVNPLKDFITNFELIQASGTVNSAYTYADIFLGSLGTEEYYPHSDNLYEGNLL